MILLDSLISLAFTCAVIFISLASWLDLAISASNVSHAIVFSRTATRCTASFSFSTVSIALASSILARPPCSRSHWEWHGDMKSNNRRIDIPLISDYSAGLTTLNFVFTLNPQPQPSSFRFRSLCLRQKDFMIKDGLACMCLYVCGSGW